MDKKYKPELRWLVRNWRRQLYSKVENLFVYENLPKEIDKQAFQLGLMRFGKLIFYKIGDKFLVQNFSYTNKLNWYYIPVHGRVVNPWLPPGHQNFEFKLEDEAIIYSCTPNIYSFEEHSLEADLIQKTATQLAENDVSYYCIQRNHRLIAIITAQDDKQRAEANRILDHMYNGDAEIVMKEDLVNRIQVNPIAMNATRSPLTELVEFQQYVLANFYHSFGINSNYNLKREQLNSSEIDVNREVLRLNIEDMLKCRENGVERINELYNINLRVHLNETVYASLLQDAQANEESRPGQEDEESGSQMGENGYETSPNQCKGENSVRPALQGDKVDGAEHDDIRFDEKGQERNPEESEETEEVRENEVKDNSNESENDGTSIIININNGETQNLKFEKGDEENVEMRDTGTVGERESDDKPV